MKRNLTLFALFSLILASCGTSMVDLAVDNPTEMDIEVVIDTLHVYVPAREVVWVEMGKGEHQITLANDSICKFNFTQDAYMLNPTMTQYLKYEQFYGNEIYRMTYSGQVPRDTVNYLGVELAGNYAIVKDLINPISWDYGPREVLPESIEMDEDEQYASLVKIVDPIELIEQLSASENN